MYEAMACARPVVLAVEGDARRIAEEAGAAICVEPENAKALASAILHLREHPGLASELGPRGRTYVETRFDYNRLTAILDVRIRKLLHEQSSRNNPSRGSANGFPLSTRLNTIANQPDVNGRSEVKTTLVQSVETDVQSYQPEMEVMKVDPAERRRV